MSKPYFVECSLPERSYRQSVITNSAVNLSLCKQIRKSRISWYPDNKGIPSIEFVGCDAEWAYNTDAEREADYNRIISLNQDEAHG